MQLEFGFQNMGKTFKISCFFCRTLLFNPFYYRLKLFLLIGRIPSVDWRFIRRIFITGIIKKSHEFIVLFVLDRIVRMTVALYTTHGGALPYIKGGVYTIDNCCYAKLFIFSTSFIIIHRISVKPSSH